MVSWRNPVADDRGFSGKRAGLAAGSVARGRHARDPCGSPAPVLPGRRYRRAREQARLAQKRRSSPPEEPLMRERLHFLLLNVGHFLDHLFTLIFATVAALALHREWGLGYADLLKYATPGFFAFGVFALPAGWLADKWSRDGMMSVFFIGIGFASIATAFARTPLRDRHSACSWSACSPPSTTRSASPSWWRSGRTRACASPSTACGATSASPARRCSPATSSITAAGASAFVVPGVVSILIGIGYTVLMWQRDHPAASERPRRRPPRPRCRPTSRPCWCACRSSCS